MKIAFIKKKCYAQRKDLKAHQYVNFLSDHEIVFSYNFGVPAIVHYLPIFEIPYM